MIRRSLLLLLLLGLLAPAGRAAEGGEALPCRLIRMVISFAPGGATDIVARMLGPKLAKRLIPVQSNSSPEGFNRYARSESARRDKIIKDDNVRID